MQEYIATMFPNLGFVQSEFSEADIAPIKQEILRLPDVQAEMSNTSGRRILRKEYNLKETIFHAEKIMLPYVSAYLNTFNYNKDIQYLTQGAPLVLDDLAVNFLDKHESNLPHRHGGVFSFIIWVDIGLRAPPSFINPTTDKDSNFSLYYIDAVGRFQQYVIPVNREWENNFILFPSEIQHSVKPCFTEEHYRTSVSGTFKFKV
jgi:hypothetical protein